MKSQGVLFSEHSIAETGIWCELSNGIDPAKWAYLCRHIGRRSVAGFENISATLLPQSGRQKTAVF